MAEKHSFNSQFPGQISSADTRHQTILKFAAARGNRDGSSDNCNTLRHALITFT